MDLDFLSDRWRSASHAGFGFLENGGVSREVVGVRRERGDEARGSDVFRSGGGDGGWQIVLSFRGPFGSCGLDAVYV